jgi:hypothetical protein
MPFLIRGFIWSVHGDPTFETPSSPLIRLGATSSLLACPNILSRRRSSLSPRRRCASFRSRHRLRGTGLSGGMMGCPRPLLPPAHAGAALCPRCAACRRVSPGRPSSSLSCRGDRRRFVLGEFAFSFSCARVCDFECSVACKVSMTKYTHLSTFLLRRDEISVVILI